MLVDNEQMFNLYRGHNPVFVKRVWAKRAAQKRTDLAEQAKRESDRKKLFGQKYNIERERAARAETKAQADASIGKFVDQRTQELAEALSRPKLSAKDVATAFAAERGFMWSEIISNSRNYELVAIRHGAIWEVREAFPALTLTQLGRIFSRDHTTILHSLRRTEKKMREGNGG